MQPGRTAAKALLRVWWQLVLLMTISGAALAGFGLYTTIVDKAPIVWFDEMIGHEAGAKFFAVFLVIWIAIGAFMMVMGRKALAALAHDGNNVAGK